MPQRFLRPGICNSERWNSVGWQEQSFYIRLITLVDDYGRYDGRPSVLWGQCFAVWNAQNSHQCDLTRIQEMLGTLESAGLLEHYESEGKQVIQITQWQERIRDGVKEKWPGNPNPQQSAAIRSKLLPPTTTTTITTTTTTPPTPSSTNDIGLVEEMSSVVPETEALESVKMNGKGKTALELMDLARQVLGEEEVKKCHRRWSDRAMHHPDQLREILHETKAAKAERRLRGSPGRYAEGACKVAGI